MRRIEQAKARRNVTSSPRAFAVGFIPLALIVTAAGIVGANEPATDAPLFERDIEPLLATHCFGCHGGEKQLNGLDLRRRSLILKGGDSGPAIVEGQPDESPLIERVEAGEMPPPEEGLAMLDDAQRALLRRWVAAGAPLQNATEPPLEESNVARVTDEDRAFWAFQPPQRPPVPTVQHQEQVRTPIDAFLLAQLERRGLAFQPDAEPAVLLRRLYIDLLGVPPTPEELAAWLADTRSDAYEQLVEKLLNDRRYGERWGRHWLDIAGYADSDGYLAADRLRPEAWRYRDYVIDAHNRDVPYDQFVREQLAGDELHDWRRAAELTPEMTRSLIATGFLRTASDPTYPGYIEPNEVHQVLSDTMQIVGSTLLGLTVQCARCHTHKFDPIPHRDYYALQAIFLPALDPARWQPSEVRGITLATEADEARITKQNAEVDQRVAALNGQLAELTARYRKKRVMDVLAARDSMPSAEVIDQLVASLVVEAGQRNDAQKQLVAQYAAEVTLTEVALGEHYPEFQSERTRLQAAVQAETALKKQLTLVRGLKDLDDQPPQAVVLQRGDHSKPGAPVAPGVLEVLAAPGQAFTPTPGYKTTGRRLEFARWLTEPDHPLTARVQVNRMWAHHFGRGIVPTVANFGLSGAPPSHPELLDWLATEFVRQNWSMKSMHRLIVCSTAYRQRSARSAAETAADPENVFLGAWSPRRMEGEVVRDSILSVSGKLNPVAGGPPAPVAPQPDGSVITADDAQGNRRSVYLIVRRSQHLTMLDLFDTPVMEVNCPERNVSTVPLQALALLHSSFAESAAGQLAARIRAFAVDDAERLGYAYRLLFTRDVTDSQRAKVLEFLAAVRAEAQVAAGTAAVPEAIDQAAWTQLALVLLNSNEFVFID